jgi:hypothetical protein
MTRLTRALSALLCAVCEAVRMWRTDEGEMERRAEEWGLW